ncbi:HEPN domain-containing protein [Jiella pelagia]|uniref:HEPN domain-containing protein n=1 Tax=Jiella pelagia TaxID=2986949 RepID=UPI0038B334CA
MINRELRSEKDRITSLFILMKKDLISLDSRLQSAFAGYMIVQSSGFIERSVSALLGEYGSRRSNAEISRFLQKTVERENSLNCEKIEKILSRFQKSWWPNISLDLEAGVTEAVDSLKTLRDQIAHGRTNGTGLLVVEGYFVKAVTLVERLEAELQ